MNTDNFDSFVLDLESGSSASPNTAGGGAGNGAGNPRGVAFWNDPDNQLFLVIKTKAGGNLLTAEYQGLTLAERILSGASLPLMRSISTPYGVLPLAKPLSLELSNIREWGCCVCHSAHGSGVAPSKQASISAHRLAHNNVFVYNPVTLTLSMWSNTCYHKYVRGMQLHSKTRKFVVTDAARFSMQLWNRFQPVTREAVAAVLDRVAYEAEAAAEAAAMAAEAAARESQPAMLEAAAEAEATPAAEAEATPAAEAEATPERRKRRA